MYLYIMRFLIILIICLSTTLLFGQNESPTVYDDAILLSPTFTFQIPAGDISERFGVNSNFGFELMYKFKKNWQVGGEGNFLFGRKVKETDHFANVVTSSGLIINNEGVLTDVVLSERGYSAQVKAGKSFYFNADNPNSGSTYKGGYWYFAT